MEPHRTQPALRPTRTARLVASLRDLGRRGRACARHERGVELVEFLAFFPLIILIMLIAWQFIMVGYTGVVAAAAAREGARAAVTLQNVGSAVQMASPGFDGRREFNANGSCPNYGGQPVVVQVRLEVPHVRFPFIGALNVYPKVTAVATMRCEPPFESR